MDFKKKGYNKKQRRTLHNSNEMDPTWYNPCNIYALNIGAPKYRKEILMNIKGEADNNTVIGGDFNTPLTSMDRSSSQKIKERDP